MKTTVSNNLKASEGTRKLVECIAVLNDHYNLTVHALNAAFGSNEVSAKMLMKECLFCKISFAGDKIDGEEIGEI